MAPFWGLVIKIADDFKILFRNGPQMVFYGNGRSGFDHIENRGRGIVQFAFQTGGQFIAYKKIDKGTAQKNGKDQDNTIADDQFMTDA